MKKDMKIRFFGRVYILPSRVKWIIPALLLAAAAAVGFFIKKSRASEVPELRAVPSPAASVTPAVEETPEPAPTPSPSPEAVVYAYVVGEVASPGVYKLPAGSLVRDAVEAAGDFTEKADREAVNLVEILSVNTMIKIPAKGESDAQWLRFGSGAGSGPDASSGAVPVQAVKVNINTATQAELCTLSGIGESTAKKIIAYRKRSGPFKAIEDIMNVPGIKEAKYLAIKDDICV